MQNELTGTASPRYYVVGPSAGRWWVMDRRPHPEGSSPIGLIWYRHQEEADQRAGELNAEAGRR